MFPRVLKKTSVPSEKLAMKTANLVQILVPRSTGYGKPVKRSWFDALLKELADRFGGATSYLRAPGEGLWDMGESQERDDIAVVEVMTDQLDESYWHHFRKRLETELSQDLIVIRAQEIIRL
jgi:hypothetical protein